MTEEERTLEEQVTEREAQPELTPETEPVSEEEAEPTPEPEVVSEPAPELVEAVKTPQEQLAEEVKTCFATGMCQKLGKRFDEVAKQLDIGVDTLIDEVFALVKGKKAEQTEG